MSHWIVAPILAPALVAAAMLLLGERRLGAQRALSVASCIALLALAGALLDGAASGRVTVYYVGDWLAPFGIALVLDRLAALMLALTAVIALVALAAALRGPEALDTRGRFFHPLYQFQLMGLNGAFLTGDLFNLFVFFEVLLIASYCLLVHGHGAARLRAGVHYVVLNLAASALFLVGVSLLYAVTGTLNMAELAVRVPHLPAGDVPLLRAAALLLLAVFALKAAAFPLYLWLPGTYAAAAPAVAALFAIMTKVGVYAILRVHGGIFGPEAGPAAFIAGPWLAIAALGSVVFGVAGALAAPTLGRMVAYLTVMSVGTLLIAVSVFSPASLAAALYYLVHSTLVVAALFLLAGEIATARGASGDRIERGPAFGRAAVLGAALLVGGMSIAGLPPLSGFVGKVMVLQSTARLPLTPVLWTVILVTGLLATVGLARAGSVLFWNVTGAAPLAPAQGPMGLVPPLALLACGLALAVLGEPVKRYADGAVAQLLATEQNAIRVLRDPTAGQVRPYPDALRKGRP